VASAAAAFEVPRVAETLRGACGASQAPNPDGSGRFSGAASRFPPQRRSSLALLRGALLAIPT
jgi:hypothetical protein